MPSISNGATRPSSTASISAPRAISTIRSWPPPACPRPEELKILEPLRGKIPDEVFTKEYNLPKTDGSGNNRANLRQADALLKQAGWIIKNGKRVNKDTGEPLRFEILLDNPLFERMALPFVAEPEAPGHRGHACARSTTPNTRRGSEIRLRHDRRRLRRVPLARQRAALLLGLGRGRSARQPEPHRHQGSGDRRADRADHRRARPRPARSPAPARSTGCCCGTTTSSRNSTWAPTAWPIGTSSHAGQARRAIAVGFDSLVDRSAEGRGPEAAGRS